MKIRLLLATAVLFAIFATKLSCQLIVEGKFYYPKNRFLPQQIDIFTDVHLQDKIGEIKQDNFNFKLPKDYINIRKSYIDEYEEKHSNFIFKNIYKIDELFGNKQKLYYSKENVEVAIIYSFQSGKKGHNSGYGGLKPGSSENIAKRIHQWHMYPAEVGSTIFFLYSEEDVQVEGNFQRKNGLKDPSDDFIEYSYYDLNIKQGWNIILKEITSVCENREGKIFDEMIYYTTVDDIPDNINWYWGVELLSTY